SWSWVRTAVAGLLALPGLLWMPVGNEALRLEARPLPGPAEVAGAFTRGLDTPVMEDVGWVVRNVPYDEQFLAVDAGILGGIPHAGLLDLGCLNNRAFAEADAAGRLDQHLLEVA